MVRTVLNYLHRPDWDRQHRWRKAVWDTMARIGLTGLHSLPMHQQWVDFHHRPMPLKNLDPDLKGFRLVQLSDLHYSPVVWKRYLHQYLEWVNNLMPDLVVITGDLITGGYRYASEVSDVLSHLRSRHGVICTFGNHDYSMYGRSHPAEGKRRADFLQKSLIERGMIVLRNQVHTVHIPRTKASLVVVGLDDEWTAAIDPQRAFAGVDHGQPIICLNHNPANCAELMSFPWQWMLSGHTHGRQVGHTRLGRRFNGHRYRQFTHGYYAVNGRHLYVNRGLSYGQRVKDWCRPEVTVFELTGE